MPACNGASAKPVREAASYSYRDAPRPGDGTGHPQFARLFFVDDRMRPRVS
jgi:hypothetical protein